MEKVLKEAKGVNGQLELLENKIRIKRRGFRSYYFQGFKGDKEILLKQISSIEFKEASMYGNGYIQFAFLGGTETHRSGGLGRNLYSNENTIVFNKFNNKDFIEIKEMIEAKMAEPDGKKEQTANLNDLEKLAELKEKGIITEEEFLAKKKQILGL